MIITCGQCQARFKVAPEQIKETGSKVRCSNCQYVFTVYRPRREEVPPGPAAAPPRPYVYSGAGQAPDYDSRIFDDDDKTPPGETSASLRAGAAADDYDPEEDDDLDFDVFFDDDLKVDKSSRAMKERRLQRRRLYSDLEEAPSRSAFGDDELDDLLNDDFDEEDFDSSASRPPLRRDSARRAKTRRPLPQPPSVGDFNEDDFEEAPEAGDEETGGGAGPLSAAGAGPAAAEEPRKVKAA
ncbi:MAG: zinc-ribbon domain-containing protein [Candidatus Adiutrix sp.]|jgi:predicted Zn finger-like uncharacterized protein|nr:zinc-ribbon domain-containing protein [Candidatus Adiutrix sp.]